jgi:hypothetical protein
MAAIWWPLFVSKEELADKHDVVIDSRIVTAMFLPSSAAVAQEMVNLMKYPTAPAGAIP